MSTSQTDPRGRGVPASRARAQGRDAGSVLHADPARPLVFGLPYAINREPKPADLWVRR